jgi:hypothetical protein
MTYRVSKKNLHLCGEFEYERCQFFFTHPVYVTKTTDANFINSNVNNVNGRHSNHLLTINIGLIKNLWNVLRSVIAY